MKSLQHTREILSRENLIGFDTSEWAGATNQEKIRSSAAKVGGKVGAKIGTKAGVKAGPARS
jgi:hypothetical protein